MSLTPVHNDNLPEENLPTSMNSPPRSTSSLPPGVALDLRSQVSGPSGNLPPTIDPSLPRLPTSMNSVSLPPMTRPSVSLSEDDIEDEDDEDDDEENYDQSILDHEPSLDDVKRHDRYLERKIDYIVRIGSLYMSLNNGFLDRQQVIDWLFRANLYNTTAVLVFRNLSLIMNPMTIVNSDGENFVERFPMYFDVFCVTGPMTCIRTLLSKYRNLSEDQTAFLLGARVMISEERISDLSTIQFRFAMRAWPGEASPMMNASILAEDWITKLHHDTNLPQLVLKRCRDLNRNHQQYFKSAVQASYTSLMKELDHKGQCITLTQAEMREFEEVLPGVFDSALLSCTPEKFGLLRISDDILGYVLGFNIYQHRPSKKNLSDAIDEILRDGVEAYCTRMRAFNERHLRSQGTPCGESDTYVLGNEEDAMLEDVYSYPISDLMPYYTDKHLYIFTRREFKSLVANSENHWTREELPATVVATLRMRRSIAKEFGLPKSDIMSTLIANLLESTTSPPEQKHTCPHGHRQVLNLNQGCASQ